MSELPLFEDLPEDAAPPASSPFDSLRKQIRREWNLPLGARVRVTLRNLPGALEGRLLIADYPERMDRRTALKLRIGEEGTPFLSTDIESCTVIDPADR